jgi:hypothetical protein
LRSARRADGCVVLQHTTRATFEEILSLLGLILPFLTFVMLIKIEYNNGNCKIKVLTNEQQRIAPKKLKKVAER